MNILFLVPYPLKQSPSQRFRFEQYFGILGDAGHSFHARSFLSDDNWREFSRPGGIARKFFLLLKGFLSRMLILPTLFRYNMVFIHREAAPLGPPIFEWLIARVFRMRVIYDFDDAIWTTDRQRESVLLRMLKWRRKVKAICRWSYKVSCGNEFLCDYARQFNNNVVFMPTTIDTESLHRPKDSAADLKNDIVIGWTGSYSTLKYLTPIESVLRDLKNVFPSLTFMVIADEPPSLNLDRLVFRAWHPATEIDDLREIDIGIMPLPDDDWAKGKCAFKALQYMALEIPTIASPVGANTAVIDHGVNGLLAATDDEWGASLSQLIGDKELRTRLGKNGREKVVARYSVRANAERFLSLFT